jgi:MFS family permease
MSRGRLAFTLAVLFGLNFMNFYDRQVVGAIGERLKNEWQLTDGQLGGLTTAFILLYAIVGIPLGRLADRGRRPLILGVGALIWSGFTALSGLASGFTALVAFRIGVGIGEASCAPTANSLLGDLFPASQRSRAISVFMLGLPLGNAASYAVSGLVMQATGGWRGALFVAAVPGIILGFLTFLIPEPARGAPRASSANPPERTRARSARFCGFPRCGGSSRPEHCSTEHVRHERLPDFLHRPLPRLGDRERELPRRHHPRAGRRTRDAGGGWLGDRASRQRVEGRLRAGAVALVTAAPIGVLALQQARGSLWNFAAFMLPTCFLHYVYYSTVYASIQDVVEPARRATAMAVYFMAFYFATAIGLYAFGKWSDHLAANAVAAGASAVEGRALGLYGAMYVIPIVAALVDWSSGQDPAPLRGTTPACGSASRRPDVSVAGTIRQGYFSRLIPMR